VTIQPFRAAARAVRGITFETVGSILNAPLRTALVLGNQVRLFVLTQAFHTTPTPERQFSASTK
jgi:hypothetical protein